MIESISIAKTATYGDVPEELSGLSQFNFLFGSNGTGKTTISRIIADETAFPTCRVLWSAGTTMQTLVYNSDFVERNFNQSAELKGIFTLGEEQAETIAKIASAKKELDGIAQTIEGLSLNLQGSDGKGGKKEELALLEEGFKAKCWTIKQKYDGKFQGAFTGYRSSAAKFKEKILREEQSNSASLQPLGELEKRAEAIFGELPDAEQVIAPVVISLLAGHESDPILAKRIVGKEDVDIAGMIQKLGNSDWVRQGRAFYEINNGVCPFCQQPTRDAFAQSLHEYFDEAFVADSKAIDRLAADYAATAARIQQQLALVIGSPTRFLDVESLKTEKSLFDSRVALNNQLLAEKKKEPSRIIELETTGDVAGKVTSLLDIANSAILEYNRTVANIVQERELLAAQVWKFMLEELKAEISGYMTARDGLEKAVAAMSARIENAEADRKKKTLEIQALERQTTSVQPTIDGINGLLSSFGFQSFKIAKAANGTSYILVRADGTDAKKTLSEGEKNFITFLYFYSLLKGSDSETGITTNRVVVFDDPVSSLDSDILFIVGSLVRALFDDVRAKIGYIKQVFVLTHNVYFHREITFNSKRCQDKSMNEETFWIVRKSGAISRLDKHSTNPIKTSYELLWTEVRNPGRSTTTIPNTLRRILESYFKILGGVDPDEICTKFEGKDKLVCRSLFSWVNAGSHHALDDLYVSVDGATVDVYLRVFAEIFKKTEHFAHYSMMMGDAIVEELSPTEAVSAS